MRKAAGMLRWSARFLSVTILVAPIILCALARADGIPSSGDKETMTVQVNDKDGKPLRGASVTPIGLRSKEEPGSYYGWRGGGASGSEAGITD
jgi:hypothetical protein